MPEPLQPVYSIYTKPSCPHCTRAKTALDQRGIPYATKHMETEAEQKALMSKLSGWRSFPAIFALGPNGRPVRFVGGADSLISELTALKEAA